MADEVYLNVPGMERTAKELSAAAQDFQGALEKLEAALTRDDKCWGDDEIGKGFEKNYPQSAEDTKTAATNLKEMVQMLADENLPSVISSMSGADAERGEAIDFYSKQLDDNTEQLTEE